MYDYLPVGHFFRFEIADEALDRRLRAYLACDPSTELAEKVSVRVRDVEGLCTLSNDGLRLERAVKTAQAARYLSEHDLCALCHPA